MIKRMHQYIDEVLTNKNGQHGELEILKVKRHIKDLKNPNLYFDKEAAVRAIKIIECFKLVEDKFAGKPLILFPFQVFFFASILGWKRKDSETGEWKRRFRKVYKSIARKNAKTTEGAALEVYEWKFSGVQSGQCYSVANSRKQALICHKIAKKIVEQLLIDSDYIASTSRVMAHSIICTSTNSTMEAMSANPNKQDGFNASYCLGDEIHEMQTFASLDIFESSMAMRHEPLMLMTTTAGFNKSYPCFDFEQMCIRVLKDEVIDETLFVDIFKMDEGDDIEDENNWNKPNPMLRHGVMSLDNFRAAYYSAKNMGASKIVEFRTKNLNDWADSASSFISSERYKENVTDTKYEGRCMIGIDLSYTKDISAVVMTFENGSVLPRFYCPSTKIDDQQNRDEVDYRKFKEAGDIVVTSGNVIDYDFIKSDIIELYRKYKPDGIIYDKRFSTQLVLDLIKKGIPRKLFHEMYQGENQYSEVVNRLEKKFHNKEYRLPENGVLEWMFRNVKVLISERGGKRFTKENERAKIDGVQAMAMAERGFIFIPKKSKPQVFKL